MSQRIKARQKERYESKNKKGKQVDVAQMAE